MDDFDKDTISYDKQKGSVIYNNNCYRIRNLTPRECGRLMGVPEDCIDKMLEIHNKTSLYKQYGNSIVVNVMAAMFSNLF